MLEAYKLFSGCCLFGDETHSKGKTKHLVVYFLRMIKITNSKNKIIVVIGIFFIECD